MNVERGKKDRGYKRVKQSRAIVDCIGSDVTFVSIVFVADFVAFLQHETVFLTKSDFFLKCVFSVIVFATSRFVVRFIDS